MSEENEPSEISNAFEIPKVFNSDLTGAPFNHCISCDKKILDDNSPYVIEKALKTYGSLNSYSTIFEYAMCMPCVNNLKGNISELSMQRMNEYFMQNVNFQKKMSQMENLSEDTIIERLNSCLVNDLPVSEINECQVYAYCIGDKLIVQEFPYMVSGQALDEIVELLSPETLDDLDRLKNELVGGPSEFQDLLQSGPKVFI